MKQFLTVLKFELGNYFKSKSFMTTTILLALVMAGVVVIPPIFMNQDSKEEIMMESASETAAGSEVAKEEGSGTVGETGTDEGDMDVLALADPGDLLENAEELTALLPGYSWMTCADEDAVKNAVESGEADAGFVLTGEFAYTYVVENRSMLDNRQERFDSACTQYWQTEKLREAGIDTATVQSIMVNGCSSEIEILGKDGANNYWYTYILIFVLYFLVIFYGQMIATSITSEKSNRAIEVLVTTVDSNSLIYGKVLAGAISGIFQAGVILGSALISYRFTAEGWGHMLDFIFDIPTTVWASFVVFGILGYLLYAFMFGMLGALVSKTEDISKSATPVTLIFVASFIITMAGMSQSDSILMKVASFIPFTSSNAMFARIALGSVSNLEIAASVGLLLITVMICAYLAAKIFRFGTLMYGNPIKFTHALKKIREK